MGIFLVDYKTIDGQQVTAQVVAGSRREAEQDVCSWPDCDYVIDVVQLR